MVQSNPYTARLGVPDRDMFFGRTAELRRAHNLLSGPSPSCLAILGPSRIGKTSLMERVKAELDSSSQGCICATMSAFVVSDRESMFRAISGVLGARGAVLKRASEPAGFLEWIDKQVSDTPTILFVDDFDDCRFASDELRFEFYDVLRSALWNRPFAVCVVIRRPLEELCSADGANSSLLWNVFTTLELGLLAQNEAHELIHVPHVRAGLSVTDEEWGTVFELVGTQPFLLHFAGFELFDTKSSASSPLGLDTLRILVRRIHDFAKPFFRGFLEYLKRRDASLVSAAVALAAGRPIASDDAHNLIRLGLAYDSPKGARLISKEFEQFVLKRSEQAPAPKSTTADVVSPIDSNQHAGVGNVFLSHSSKDRIWVRDFCGELLASGIDVWTDWLHIQPGENFDRAIEEALVNATHVLLVVSPNSLQSDYVRSEVEWALSENKTVIPIVLQDTHIPPRWHALQRLFARTEAERASTIAHLFRMLPQR